MAEAATLIETARHTAQEAESLERLRKSIGRDVWRPVFDDDGREVEEPSRDRPCPRIFGGYR